MASTDVGGGGRAIEIMNPRPNRAAAFVRADFARHSSIVLASTVIVNVFNYLFHTVVSRALGPSDYGELASLLSIFLIVSFPAGVISMVMVKFVAEFHVLNEPERISAFCRRVTIWLAAISGVLIVGVMALGGEIAAYLHFGGHQSGAGLGFMIAAALLLSPFRGVLQGVERFSQLAASFSIEAFGKLGFGVLAIYLGRGVPGILWGVGLGSAISVAYTAYVVYRAFGFLGVAPRIDWRRLLKSTATVSVTLLAITVLGFADILFVKHYFSAPQAGLYGIASLVGKGLYFLVSFAAVVVLPKASLEAARGRAALPTLARAVAVIAALSAIVILTLFFFKSQVVTLLAGKAFAGAGALLLPYGIAMTFLAMANLITSYWIGAHRSRFLGPLVIAAVAEIVLLQFMHASLMQFVVTLAIGHFVVFCSTLFGFVPREGALMRQIELEDPFSWDFVGAATDLEPTVQTEHRYLIVLPTYNELDNIASIINRVLAASPALHVLVVDDASPDGTADLVRSISEENDRVSLMVRSGKLGLGSAYLVGFRYAIERGFRGVCTMDADHSHDPACLPSMMQRLQTADLVIGSRYVAGGSISNWNFFRRINSWVANTLARMSISTQVKDCTSGYRLYSTELLSRMNLTLLHSTGYSMLVELLDAALRRNAVVSEFPIHFENRSTGESKMGSKEIFESLQTYRRLRFARALDDAITEEKVVAG